MKKKVVPMIHVPDVRATVEWYESIGFTTGATYGDETGGNFSFAIMSFGDTEVMFNTDGETSEKHRREVDLYVYTDNVDELYENLKARVDVIEKPHDKFYGMRELIIRDINRFWITFGEQSAGDMLMAGVYEGDPERVRLALASGRIKPDTLNVALAFASATEKKKDEIIAMLAAAGAQPPPQIDPATLESYAGSYKGPHGIAAEITMKDGRLFAAPAGQDAMSLWPLDQVTFKPVAIDGVSLKFEVENGKAVALILTHNGHSIKLDRE